MASSRTVYEEHKELANPDAFHFDGSACSSHTAVSDRSEEDDDIEMQPPKDGNIVGAIHRPLDEKAPTPAEQRRKRVRLAIWMVINTLATIGIVFTNKTIFDAPSLRNIQLSFAAFHFLVTGLTLYLASRPRIGLFAPRAAPARDMVPLAAAMCLQVVLPNLSLAHSSVTFYQLARILLTPGTALLNLALYGRAIPRAAAWPLVPVCAGVAVVSYYDSLPARAGEGEQGQGQGQGATTSFLGAAFALAGVMASSLYTVWVGHYHVKLRMSSMQLLMNQAPVGALLLMYAVPWVDTKPDFGEVRLNMWILIAMSGFYACLINLSQFFIIDGAGPVSSTVVGHLKTCTIVALGWATSGRTVRDKSIVGIVMALLGIIAYSVIMLLHKKKDSK